MSTASGVVDVTNTGGTNGVQGKASSLGASGVYGENTSSGGFGVAGRSGTNGHAVYGDNTGTGYAGYFEDKVFIGGPLDCSGCVDGADVTGKVGNADQLDGIDSAEFGKASGQALAEGPGAWIFLGPAMEGFIRLSYACPGNLASNGLLRIQNDSASAANVFVESGEANPTYAQLAGGGGFKDVAAAPAGDSFHIQAQGGPGVQTIEVATVHRASDCHAQAQGLLATSP